MAKLTSYQQQVANHREGAALVLAPPGSGKSTTLLARAADLIEDGVKGEEILVTTFSRRSVTDLQKRAQVHPTINTVQIKTLHSLGLASFARKSKSPAFINNLNQHYGLHYRVFKAYPKVIKSSSFFLTNALKDAGWSQEQMKKVDVKGFLHFIGIFKRKMFSLSTPSSVKQYLKEAGYNQAQVQLFLDVWAIYEQAKGQKWSIDFDDMLYLPTPFIDDSDRAFEYIMNDEYQDASILQNTLVTALLRNENFMGVGDVRQAIFSFTGAVPEDVIYKFKDMWPNSTLYNLAHNFRSVPGIITTSTALSAHMELPFEAEVLVGRQDGQEGSQDIMYPTKGKDEGEMIAERILGMLESGRAPEDIAVIYRINSQSRLIEDALLKAKIPYIIHGGTPFFNRKDVKDLVALAMVAHNPRMSDVAVERVINMATKYHTARTRFLGEAFITRLKSPHLYQGDLFTTILTTTHQKYQVPGVEDFKRFIKECQADTISGTLQKVFDIVYFPFIRGEEATGSDDEDDALVNTLEELKSVANEYGDDHDFQLFFEYVINTQRQTAAIKDDEGVKAVQLMTYHKSKGLEFDTVFLPALVNGMMPFKFQAPGGFSLELHRQSQSGNGSQVVKDMQLQEERRLFFVGVTRAANHLIYSIPAIDRKGQTAYPSIFLPEADVLSLEQVKEVVERNTQSKDDYCEFNQDDLEDNFADTIYDISSEITQKALDYAAPNAL